MTFTTALALLLILAALAIGIVAIVAWVRARPPRPIIIPMYDRPPGIDLLESAALVRRDTRGVQSALVDLAVRRKVRILVAEGAVEDGPRGSTFTIELLDDSGLSPLETRLVGLLMGAGAAPGARHELQGGGTPTGESPALVRLRAAARRSIRDRDLMRAPDPSGTVAVGRLANLVFAATVALVFIAFVSEEFTPLLVLAILLTGGIALILVPRLLTREPIPTAEGARLRDHLLGLRMYLELAEQDRFRMLQSPEGADRVSVTPAGQPDPESALKLFERLLPFAVLWGLDDRWTREMSPYLPEAPSDWYDGGDFSSFAIHYSALSYLLASDPGLDASAEDADAGTDDGSDGSDSGSTSDAGADWGDDGGSASGGGFADAGSSFGPDAGGGSDGFAGFGSGDSGWGGGDFGGGGDSGGGGDGGGGGGGD